MRNWILKAALAGAMSIAALPAPALAAVTVVNVLGTADPQLAGHPNGTTLGGDSAPANSPALALTGFATGTAITFSGVGGFRSVPGITFGLDGGGGFFNQGDALSIAGLRNAPLNGLVGVFLDANVPSGPAPVFRDLSIDGTGFASLSA